MKKKNNKIKKCWVIERKYEFYDEKKLLAIFNFRTPYEKIILAMKTLMMADCENYKDILTINSFKKDNPHYPHLYNRVYPIIIGEGTMYYKAPYKAWITELNTETGEYTDIEEKFKDYMNEYKYLD